MFLTFLSPNRLLSANFLTPMAAVLLLSVLLFGARLGGAEVSWVVH